MIEMTLDRMEREHGALWRFETPRYVVAFWAEPEDMDPADSFEFAEDIAAVLEERVDWFCAFVGVFTNDDDGEMLGFDCLGGCAYTSARDFARGENRNGYFRDMVRAAVSQAREREIAATMTYA